MSVEIEKKIAVFMSDEEFDNYRRGNELINKLVEEVGELKSNQQVDRQVEITIYTKSNDSYGKIYFEFTDMGLKHTESDSDLSERVVMKLNSEESLLKNLVTEIQNLNTKNDKLQYRIDSLPSWIKWFMK